MVMRFKICFTGGFQRMRCTSPWGVEREEEEFYWIGLQLEEKKTNSEMGRKCMRNCWRSFLTDHQQFVSLEGGEKPGPPTVHIGSTKHKQAAGNVPPPRIITKCFIQLEGSIVLLHQLHFKLVQGKGRMALVCFEKVAILFRIADTTFNCWILVQRMWGC